MTMPAPQLRFDASALTEPVDPRAVRAFAAELKARRTSVISVASIITIAVVAVAGLVIVPTMFALVVGIAQSGHAPFVAALPMLFILLVVVLFGGIAWAGWRTARVTRYRLNRFAQANGMAGATWP